MTITRADVADLQPGDVVEVVHEAWPTGTVIRGPLTEHPISGALMVAGDIYVRRFDGSEPAAGGYMHLTVISRAPRPLYVNHPRTEPVAGDVARQESGCPSGHTWHYLGDDRPHWWRFDDTRIPFDENARLSLLVDGETGQVVP
jgi:hypothetical protein